jgi:hypothetical protein
MSIDPLRLAEALRTLVTAPPTMDELPRRLCIACQRTLPVDGVGVSLITNGQTGGRILLGASDPVGAQIEQLQFDLGEGPCASAFAAGQPVLVPDTRGEDARRRWPMFTQGAEGLAVGSLFAFPLQVGSITFGVLDCHRSRPGPLVEIDEVLAVADALTVALLHVQASTTEGRSADVFDLAWRNHAEVHQATGWLSAALGIPVADALARLRGYAFGGGRPLHAVAADILAGRLTLAAEEK